MTARILDGKGIADRMREEIAEEAARFREQSGIVGHLAAVLVGEDPASQVYVRNKQRACKKVGLESSLNRLPASTSQKELLGVIERLNRDPEVHGILVQLPLPTELDESPVILAVDPAKDVDALHPYNIGLLAQGRPRFLPCTPAGIQQILIREEIEIAGAHVVIVGRSNLVGRPLALMLAQKAEDANATVTLCHSRTTNLAEHTRRADILVAAIGRQEFITREMIKPGAVVIDVGINRTEEGKLVGDVDFAAASEIASAITPVPGGVGPMTVTLLLQNTLKAARLTACQGN